VRKLRLLHLRTLNSLTCSVKVLTDLSRIFPAKFIPTVGFIQDGGVGKHNNPVDPVYWESRIAFDADPDLTVSIGSGFAQQPSSPRAPSTRHGFWDGPIPRLLRSFGTILVAQNNHVEHLNRLESLPVDKEALGSYFRINIPFEYQPALDEIGKMADLRRETHLYLQSQQHILLAIKQALRSASFFFELSEMPSFQGRWYECRGSIRCRSLNAQALVCDLAQKFPSAQFLTDQNTNLGNLNEGDLCIDCGIYNKAVKFPVYHLGQKVTISLRLNQLYRRKISGFPNSITWFVERQRLNADFGEPGHSNPKEVFRRKCDCSIPSVPTRKRSLVHFDRDFRKKHRQSIFT